MSIGAGGGIFTVATATIDFTTITGNFASSLDSDVDGTISPVRSASDRAVWKPNRQCRVALGIAPQGLPRIRMYTFEHAARHVISVRIPRNFRGKFLFSDKVYGIYQGCFNQS